LIAQQQYFSLMERQYCYEGGKWYTYSQVHIGDEILLHRIIVRLIDRDDMKSFDFAGYNIQGISVGSRRILSGFYLLKVVSDADPFKIATQLENTGLFDVIEFDALGQNLETPNDPQYINQWNLKEDRLDMPHAWDISTGSSQVIIAVIDGGVLYTHEDLDGNLWVNPLEDLNHNGWPNFFSVAQGGDLDGADNDGNDYIDDLIGWDCFDDDNLPEADTHGTRVTGVAVAQTNNFENGQYRGVAGIAGGWGSQKGVKFMTLDDLDPTPIGPDAFAMAEAIQYATDNGADVINISQIFQYDPAVVREAVNYATTNPNDVVIVCGTGNNGNIPMWWPARYYQTISVGATTQDDTRWFQYPEGSQKGDEAHDIYLDVMAPGAPASVWTTESNGGYAQMGKTSAATPHVAGIAALMRSINSDLQWEQVRDILQASADKVAGMNGNYYTDEYGYGRVDAYQSLLMALAYANKTPNISPTIYNNQRILARGQNSPATVLHEVFAAGVSESYEVFYRRSSNNGSSWDITTRLSPGTEKNLQPCLTIVGQFRLE
jgi:subtilisin family serine protease